MKFLIIPAILASFSLVGVSAAFAAGGSPELGAKVFLEECSDCHSVAAEMKNKKGPSLWGISGRKSGSVAGFEYSDGMKRVAIVWTADKIDPYITHPKKVVPGGKMKFDGLSDEKSRADIIAYLMTLH